MKVWVSCMAFVFLLFGNTQLVHASSDKVSIIDFWSDSEPNSKLPMDHSSWDEILKEYVVTNHPSGVNRFDYDRVTKADQKKLNL